MTLIPGLEQQLVEAAGRRHARRRRGTSLAAALAVALSALASFTLLSPSGDNSGGDSATAGGVSPELTELLAVFRRPRTTADELPGDPLAELRSTGDARPGEDPTSSRRVDLAPGTVYLWPMDGGVCRSWGTSGGCMPIDILRRRGVAVATSLTRDPDGGEIDSLAVAGIVVDGIRDVRLVREGAPDIPVQLTDNVFWVDLRGVNPPPSSIRWADERGQHSQRLHLF